MKKINNSDISFSASDHKNDIVPRDAHSKQSSHEIDNDINQCDNDVINDTPTITPCDSEDDEDYSFQDHEDCNFRDYDSNSEDSISENYNVYDDDFEGLNDIEALATIRKMMNREQNT